jgi:hypothetical protein
MDVDLWRRIEGLYHGIAAAPDRTADSAVTTNRKRLASRSSVRPDRAERRCA